MAVHNVHERELTGIPPERVGRLIDELAGDNDRIWPVQSWPAMRLGPGLQLGARGGHGPIRYTIEQYAPGFWVRCRFTGPHGVHGYHEFSWRRGATGTVLRHDLVVTPRGPARLAWPLALRWLHDALLEDLLDRAEQVATGSVRRPSRWSAYVRLLRAGARRRPGTRAGVPQATTAG